MTWFENNQALKEKVSQIGWSYVDTDPVEGGSRFLLGVVPWSSWDRDVFTEMAGMAARLGQIAVFNLEDYTELALTLSNHFPGFSPPLQAPVLFDLDVNGTVRRQIEGKAVLQFIEGELSADSTSDK